MCRVEKTPRHINYLDLIFRLDPAARVVLVVRDGRDVAASLKDRGSPWVDCMGRCGGQPCAARPPSPVGPGLGEVATSCQATEGLVAGSHGQDLSIWRCHSISKAWPRVPATSTCL